MRDVVERLTSEANTSPDDAAVFWGYEARKRKRSKRISRSGQVFTVYQNSFSLHLFLFLFKEASHNKNCANPRLLQCYTGLSVVTRQCLGDREP